MPSALPFLNTSLTKFHGNFIGVSHEIGSLSNQGHSVLISARRVADETNTRILEKPVRSLVGIVRRDGPHPLDLIPMKDGQAGDTWKSLMTATQTEGRRW